LAVINHKQKGSMPLTALTLQEIENWIWFGN
jgi:hypothetical protein